MHSNWQTTSHPSLQAQTVIWHFTIIPKVWGRAYAYQSLHAGSMVSGCVKAASIQSMQYAVSLV